MKKIILPITLFIALTLAGCATKPKELQGNNDIASSQSQQDKNNNDNNKKIR